METRPVPVNIVATERDTKFCAYRVSDRDNLGPGGVHDMLRSVLPWRDGTDVRWYPETDSSRYLI